MKAPCVRDLFVQAKKNSPCLVPVINDAAGRQRGAGTRVVMTGEHTLNQLLVEMDGLVSTRVLLFGSYQPSDVLDPTA